MVCAALVALFLGCSPEAPMETCERDVDCPLGFFCSGGACQRECSLDVDCAPRGAGATCNMRGRCTVPVMPDAGMPMDGGPTGCVGNDDCADGVYCNGVERCAPEDPSAGSDGCAPATESACPEGVECLEESSSCAACTEDLDGDRVRSERCGGRDCDDADSLRFPGNPEVCGADPTHDEDCDPTTFGRRDRDGDGVTTDVCCNVDDATGMSACGTDCDDDDAERQPGRLETCDVKDNDCDTRIDEDSIRTFYRDTDGDGYGSPEAETAMGCEAPTGFVTSTDDCAPDDRDTNPGVGETRCDLEDDNCNGETDEGLAGVSCSTGLPGACATGSVVCSATGAVCTGATAPMCAAGTDRGCDLCGFSGRQACNGCVWGACTLMSGGLLGHWSGADPALHPASPATCGRAGFSGEWSPTGCSAGQLMVAGPQRTLPPGLYTVRFEAITNCRGVFGVVGATIVSGGGTAPSDRAVHEMVFRVTRTDCGLVYPTVAAFGCPDLAFLDLTRTGD